MVNRKTGILGGQILRRVSMLTLILTVGFVITIVVGLSNTLQNVRTRLDDTGQVAARTFDLFLAEINSELLTTRHSLAKIDDANQVFQQVLARQPAVIELFLVDTRGEIIAQSRRAGGVELATFTHQPWLQTVYAGETYVGPINFEEYGVPFVDIALAVTNEAGNPAATLLARVELTVLWNDISRIRVGETGYIYLTDRDSQLLVFRDWPPVKDGATIDGLFERSPQTIAAANLGFYDGVGGQKVFAAGVPLDISPPWFAVVEQPAGEVFRPFMLQFVPVVVALLLVGVLMVSNVHFARSRIVSPLLALREGIEMLRQGSLNYHIDLQTRDEMGDLASAFNIMMDRQRDLIDTLEDRIQERTSALEVGARISHQMTIILNLDELLQFVVDRIQTEFNFYHTHIYLIEEETGDLIMAHGFGEVGRQLKARGHRLLAGQGIVGMVAGTNEHFMSNNVDDVLNFVRNDLLPETKSELAVPLRKREKVLGVLDIQSRELDHFSPTSVSIMQSIANHTAVTLDNIRLLEATQKAVREVERLNRRLTRVGWDEAIAETQHNAYRFLGGERTRIGPVADAKLSAMERAITKKQLVVQAAENGKAVASELAIPLVLRGEVIGVVGVKRDKTLSWSSEEIDAITSVANQTTLALENARLSKEQEKTIVQLRDIDRLKSEFLTSMSHELRTPLNSIIGFADILLQGIDGPLSDHAETDINAIHNSGKHLLALINDLLDLSKIEAGRMELACNALSILDTFEEVAASASSLLTKKAVELIFDMPDELPRIWADPLRINQILLNLVSNAIKFTEEGTVTMKAEVNDRNLMKISVIDTGIGIPIDKFDLVFEHFRQVDARTNRRFQGTGMGLAIAKQLVGLHGGAMWVESVEGEGSIFSFTIPLATVEQLKQES